MTAIEHDALRYFIKATEDFESRFGGVIVGLSGPKTQTGEVYCEFLNGRRRDAVDLDEVFYSAHEAIDATFSRLSSFFPIDPTRLLQWRIKPEIDYSPRRKGYVTYCRFALSDHPS